MNQPNADPPTKDGQIFLLDVCRIIVARKWLVLLCPILTVFAAVFYLVTTKAVYECRAALLVGQVGKARLLRTPALIAKQVSEKHRVDDRTVKRIYPRVVAVDFDKKDSSNVVFIKVADFTPEGATTFLKEVLKDVFLEQELLYQESLQIIKEHLQTLTTQIAAYEDYKAQLNTHIDQTASKDPAQAAVLALERGQFLGRIPDLVAQQFELQMLLKLESYPAHLLFEPQVPDKPVRPRRVLVLLLATISGCIFGVTAAFVAEMVRFGRIENLTVKGKN